MAVTERKYYDSEFSGTLTTIGGDWTGTEVDPATLNTLCVPVTGNDINNRIGRKIDVLSIKIRGAIVWPSQTNQTAADTCSQVRVILYQDKQTNATQAQGEQLINSGGASQALYMFQNPASFGRFRVLKDKMYSVGNPSITYDGTNVEQSGLARNFKMNVKFKKPVRINFNSTNGGTVADIVDNSFHIIVGAIVGTSTTVFQYKSRVVYVDP